MKEGERDSCWVSRISSSTTFSQRFLASLIHEHIHKVIVAKLLQVVNCVERIAAFIENHSGHALRTKWLLPIGVGGIAAPLIPRDDTLQDRSAAITSSINNSLDRGFCLYTVRAPRLISFLVDRASEDSNELIAGGRMLVKCCLEGFSVFEVDGHFCEVAQISFLE